MPRTTCINCEQIKTANIKKINMRKKQYGDNKGYFCDKCLGELQKELERVKDLNRKRW